MRKICFIDYDMSVRGGVEQVTASLVNALAESCEVHLLSIVQKGNPIYTIDERVHSVTLLKEEKRLSEMRRELKTVLSDYLRENGIEVMIIQGNYPGFLASVVRGRVKTKLIFCDHGALMNQWSQKDIVVIRLITSLLCHRVVTLTEQSRCDYIKRFLLPKKKVQSIYNWIDTEVPHSEKYDISSKKIVSAGRFGKEKGFDMLIKAFAPAAKRHPDWTLDIFGDGEMMEEVKKLIKEYGIGDKVNLLGMRSDLADRYRDYAFYVLPSYREGLPLVLLEAKLNRLPIVSFDILTGPREIVRDGIDGILIPPYDTEKMGEAISHLMENGDERQKMSDKSQENIDKFSKETILREWMELIENI